MSITKNNMKSDTIFLLFVNGVLIHMYMVNLILFLDHCMYAVLEMTWNQHTTFSPNKHRNIKILLLSIAQSTGQYFPVLVQLYWECTVKYTPSRAGAIFSSTLPVELGV